MSRADPRATVLIPTYGHAPFVRCAIASVQAQTIRELEICVVLDGSPPDMKPLVERLAAQDERIRVFDFLKAPRTGEVHRARVIEQTRGRIICYLSHDDLWFSNHVESLEQSLAEADFVHSMHVSAGLGEAFATILDTLLCDLSHPEVKRRMLDQDHPKNYFGLSFAAHTREAYSRLPAGWAVTPDGTPTDLHMWRKFLREPAIRVASLMTLTALHFPAPMWAPRFSAEELEGELARYLARLGEPEFQGMLLRRAFQGSIAGLIDREIQLAESMKGLSSLIEAEAGRRIRELPVRKIWKLVWKRMTRQYRREKQGGGSPW